MTINECTKDELKNLCTSKDAIIKEQKAEIEKMQKYNAYVAFKQYNNGRTEAIKEFAERLKKRMGFCDLPMEIVKDHIDLLVKEMVGGENA